MFFVFFFKQKTAYEVRISDWSSDVCSSDLQGLRAGLPVRGDVDPVCPGRQARQIVTATGRAGAAAGQPGGQVGGGDGGRSEEHTSELQSLMRISYAVFCLKKKTKTQRRQ